MAKKRSTLGLTAPAHHREAWGSAQNADLALDSTIRAAQQGDCKGALTSLTRAAIAEGAARTHYASEGKKPVLLRKLLLKRDDAEQAVLHACILRQEIPSLSIKALQRSALSGPRLARRRRR